MLKRFDNGNLFMTFEDISESDKEHVQSFIYEHLQRSFNKLLAGAK
jgi:hypothetical protein